MKTSRARVSTTQKYEVAYEARKMGVRGADVIAAAKKVGPMRKAIEAELRRTGKAKKAAKKAVKKAAKKKAAKKVVKKKTRKTARKK